MSDPIDGVKSLEKKLYAASHSRDKGIRPVDIRLKVTNSLSKTVLDMQRELAKHIGQKPTVNLTIKYLISRIDQLCNTSSDIRMILGLEGKDKPSNDYEVRLFLRGIR